MNERKRERRVKIYLTYYRFLCPNSTLEPNVSPCFLVEQLI